MGRKKLEGRLAEALEQTERATIGIALRESSSYTEAAKLLGISLRGLWLRIERLAIQVAPARARK
jgi:transcriptional regulator with PAS, ATPase and Fis domain